MRWLLSLPVCLSGFCQDVSLCVCPLYLCVRVCNNNPTVDMSVTLHGSINAIITCNQQKEAASAVREACPEGRCTGVDKGLPSADCRLATGDCHMANARKESLHNRLTKGPPKT